MSWIICLYIWYQVGRQVDIPVVGAELMQAMLEEFPRYDLLQSTTTHSDNYDTLIAREELLRILNRHSFRQRCNMYFNELMLNETNFVNPHTHFGFNRNHFDTDKDSDEWKTIQHDEQKMHNYMTHLKIFNKCYVDNQEERTFVRQQKKLIPYQKPVNFGINKNLRYKCEEVEAKLYPWLSFQLPVSTKWDGTISQNPLPSSGWGSPCFLSNFKKMLNGRGIVLTIADGHLDTTLRLINLLKALENTLPIEVVYYKGLSQESMTKLVHACRKETVMENKVLPLQDISFVNVSTAVKPEYIEKFSQFGNKILATLFNSFEEMILLDADTVILENPEFFFNLAKYKKTGTMFYKDRSTVEYRPKYDLVFFRKLLPSLMDSVWFNFPQTTEYTLENEFFKGLNHYMESGLVVINRSKHFTQPLIMSQLNFHLSVQARVYGDKELFWLALVISGDENYSFNDHFLASIGQLTPSSERDPSKYNSKELCSNHPGHINDEDDHSLLWFNSGFMHCGQNEKVDFKHEFKDGQRYTSIKSLEKFKAFFYDKLILKHAIVPARHPLEADNIEGEPSRAWINMRAYCAGYTWCAYSGIGGLYSNDDKTGPLYNNQTGLLVEFTNRESDKFEKLGDAWLKDPLAT